MCKLESKIELNHILWYAASTCTYFSVINIKRERLLLNAAKRGNLDEVKEFLKSTYVDTNEGAFGFNSNHETPLIKAGKKFLHIKCKFFATTCLYIISSFLQFDWDQVELILFKYFWTTMPISTFKLEMETIHYM